MEWDKDAVAIFIKMPVIRSVKESTKVLAEALARKSGSERVTVKELEAAKKVTYGRVSEKTRQLDIDKRISRC
ncbi:MAG: PCP reductase family protein, partial [Dehalococcoidales bacterium]